ncbi:MAG: nuclear transport factor 2 family protein [Mycobacteriales bacterium]
MNQATVDEIQTLVAEGQIRNLVALYAQYADDALVQEWSELFDEDGLLESGPTRPKGREALAQWLTDALRGPKLRHLTLNTAIVLDSATEAHGSSDLVVLAAMEGAWTVVATARYADRFVKTAGGWRFAERVLTRRDAAG